MGEVGAGAAVLLESVIGPEGVSAVGSDGCCGCAGAGGGAGFCAGCDGSGLISPSLRLGD